MATYVPYTQGGAKEAEAAFRGLQTGGASGLRTLMASDPYAERGQIQQAMYESQAEGINRAAEQQRQGMLEGTFARGVGPSTITMELAGRLSQEQNDANARAMREAYLGAGAEQRANLAALQNLYTSGIGAGTTGLQAEANVGLTNTGRQLQAAMGAEELASRQALQASQLASQERMFQQNLAREYAALEQQAMQFNRQITSAEREAALNRALQVTLQESQQGWQSGEAEAMRAWQSGEAATGRTWQEQQAAATRAWQTAEAEAARGWQGGQSTAGREWQAEQNALNRALTAAQFEAAQRQQAELFGQQQTTSAIGAGIGGIANFFAPVAQAGSQAINDWLASMFGLQAPTS